MISKKISYLLITTFLLAITFPAKAYRQVIDLGTLGGNLSVANSINDKGQVVGVSRDSTGYVFACLFDNTGSDANLNLGTLPSGFSSNAYYINNNGSIAGYSDFRNSSSPQACLFDSSGGKNNISLGSLGYIYGLGEAHCINNNNQVVGSAYDISGHPHACLFDTQGGVNKDLGTSIFSNAWSINNSGIIVGSDYFRACIFDSSGNGANLYLGSLGGNTSEAYCVNENNKIVGLASSHGGDIGYHACLFDSSGGGNNIDLGILTGDYSSVANAINNSDQIVGYSFGNTQIRACLFDPTRNGNNIDLNTLINPASGWMLNRANSINNNGWIVGEGTLNGQTRAFLLIPEPVTILLLGLGGISFIRRKHF